MLKEVGISDYSDVLSGKGGNMKDLKMEKKLHLIIVLAWLLPCVTNDILLNMIVPFFVTFIFILLDLRKSNGEHFFDSMVPVIIVTNIIGAVLMAVIYVLAGYASGQDPNFGPGYGFYVGALFGIIYMVILAITIGITYLFLFIKNKLVGQR